MGRRALSGRRHSTEEAPTVAAQTMLRAAGSPRPRTRNLSPSAANEAPADWQHQLLQEGFMGQQLGRQADGQRQQQQESATRRAAGAASSRRRPEAAGKRQVSGKLARTRQASEQSAPSTRLQANGELPLSNPNGSISEPNNNNNNNNGSNAHNRHQQQARSTRHHQAAEMRPQSALAGSQAAGPMQGFAGGPQTNAAAAVGPRRDSAGALAQYNSSSLRPAKTTRVRINSTSEQIEDPNWLIRMSRELEQPQPKKSHLRSLHRKLKSTIGSGSSSRQQSHQQSLTSDQQPEDPSLPPLKPFGTPVKVPVSILKQRGSPRLPPPQPSPQRGGPVPAAVPQVFPAQLPAGLGSQQPTNRQPRAASQGGGARQPRSLSAVQPQSTGQPTSPAHSTQSSRPQSPSQLLNLGRQPEAPATSHQQRDFRPGSASNAQTSGQKSANPQPAQPVASSSGATGSSSRPEPICAEGQVKVSGWKRNNLLAKTLSHLDEIRGNQRPVFVPTKIRLPPSAAQEPPSAQVAAARSPSPSSSKFAEIVREAMASKRSGQTQPATKRTLDGESKEQDKETGSGHQQELLARAASADPTTGGGASLVNSMGNSSSSQAASSQHQHRSSSAGLPGGKQQQVMMSRTNAQQQQQQQSPRHGSQTPSALNTPTIQQPSPLQRASVSSAVVTPHLMNQLLTVSAHQSSQLLESGSSSTRQFKLQQKNHQVLQNLRRQSNELQASLNAAALRAAAEEAAGNSPGASPNGGGQTRSGRTKDWKRLAGKLGLLKGGGGGARHALLSLPRSTLGSALSVERDSPSGGQLPLRLTVSNQETCLPPDSRQLSQQKRASGQNLQLPGGSLLVPGQSRRLSSSSMVVEPAAASGRRNNGPRLSQGGPEFEQQMAGQRRSSDSEAYRASTGRPHLNLAKPVQTDARAGSSGGAEPLPNRPVVVNRNDLLQLLKVTSSSGSQQLQASNESLDELLSAVGGTGTGTVGRRSLQLAPDQLPASVRDSVAHGDNKQLAASDGDKENSRDGSERAGTGSVARGWLEQAKSADLAEPGRVPSAPRLRRSSSVKSMDGLVVMLSESAPDEDSPTAQDNHKEVAQQPASGKRRTDLSWVVKKTSKVVFFHEKLRKMRWHMKQSTKAQPQAQRHESNELASGELPAARGQEVTTTAQEAGDKNEPPLESHGDQDHGHETAQSPAGPNAGDVFMDPELIGDAIEIFLRSTMQQTAGGAHKSAGGGADDDQAQRKVPLGQSEPAGRQPDSPLEGSLGKRAA